MQTTREKNIGGHTYQVTQLPGMAGMKMLPRLGRVLGPALGKAIGAARGTGTGFLGMELWRLGDVIPALFDNLTGDELEALTREFLAAATVDGRPLMREFDVAMQGRAGEGLVLLAFALEVNYGNFSDALAAGGVLRAAMEPFLSQASSTSNGQPGVSS